MKTVKKTITLGLILSILVVSLVFALPEQVQENTNKKTLEKVTFIHYKNNHAKPAKTTNCYTFLSKGAKWKTNEPYYVNPTNLDGLTSNFVLDSVNLGVAEWEGYGGNIFGEGLLSDVYNYNNGNYDEINTASFGFYPDTNVIAVTTVWGYFSGPPQTREIVEWDMLFNEIFTWGDATSNPALMDLQNIATHELGHSAGMGDLYTTTCTLETMYGYSTEGETIKRDLNTGDIKGIQTLY
ncbi:MAG: matrixin family metalloprotease [archaeon]